MQLQHRQRYIRPVWILILGLALFMAGARAHAQIAFMSERDGNKEIYVMGADGRSPRNITRHPADDWTPALSPNGKRLAFMSDRDDGNYDIYVMDTRHPWSDESIAFIRELALFQKSGNLA